MDGADRGRDGASGALRRRDSRRTDGAVRRQRRRHQRLFPRSGRLADGIHLVYGQGRNCAMTVLHDPTVLPADLPVPPDDGAARHLAGTRLPDLALMATDGTSVNLSRLVGRTVVYFYPRTGRPGQALPEGWDAIPGARGCTPQS